jgi:hypothetical protein
VHDYRPNLFISAVSGIGELKMKIQQETLPYRPVTIKLDRYGEAKALFDLMALLDSFVCNDGEVITPQSFTREQRDLMIKLVNARTEGDVVISAQAD